MAKKSWRDIDKGRNQSAHTNNGKPGRRVHTPKAPRGYKADLNKLFDRGEVPDRFKEVMATDASGTSAERQKLIRQARNSESTEEFCSLIEEFLKRFNFPDDAELLIRVLDHPSEEILCKALDQLIEMDGNRPLPKRPIIRMKLKTIEQIATDSKTVHLVEMLTERL